ncbi:MAG: hypothetical protein PHH61_06285 [Candidatus Nanoarchaeia archaeon]|nr:hypothetical protein [Candidatus Nanoarchaeia archaeon]
MEQTVKTLKSYINGRYYNVFEYDHKKMIRLIDFMKERFKNEKPIGDNDRNNVINSLAIMFDAICLKTLTGEDRVFIKSYNLLCYNLGMAYDIKELKTRCEAISTLIEYQNSMVAQIEVSKRMLKFMEKYEKFHPPACEMSSSYLANIQERLNKV